MTRDYVPPSYPVLAFIAARGMPLALAIGALVAACGVGWALAAGGWLVGVLGVAGGALLAALLASYVELARIVMDTLVPR